MLLTIIRDEDGVEGVIRLERIYNYYLLFWMFMGFIIHFYIIFVTNLLTQSPVPVSVFTLF